MNLSRESPLAGATKTRSRYCAPGREAIGGAGGRITEKATGLWKTNHTSDCFYHFEMGLSASLVKNFELKVAYLVDYKNLPNPPTLKKTDTALIAAIVYKF
ncbi:MAG TPA: DUF481 domain-containing protein [Thermoanaerobaculia bacterium]